MAWALLVVCAMAQPWVAHGEEKLPELTQLSHYLDQAAQKSPALSGGRHRVGALQHQAQAAGRLPDLKLAWGEMIVPVETKVGPQQRAFSISQTIPWFGTLGLRRAGLLDQAAVAQAQLDGATIKLNQKIRATWYRLAQAQQDLELYRQQYDLAVQLLPAIQAAYETGQANFAELVAAQSKLARLEVSIQDREDRFKPLTARLNQLAGLDSSQSMPLANLMPPPLPRWVWQGHTLAVADSLETHNPDLKIQRNLMQVARTDLKLAGLRSRPDLTVGLDYIMTDEGDNPSAVDAGKDPVIARLALSLPIWGGRPGVPAEARDRSLLAEQASYNQQKLDLLSAAEDIGYRIRSARRNLVLYSQTLLPRAAQELEAVSAAYQAGQAGFARLLEAQQTVLDLQLAQLQARTDQAMAMNDLAALLGPLPRNLTYQPILETKEMGP